MKIKKFNELSENQNDKIIRTTYQKTTPVDSEYKGAYGEDEYDEESGWEDEEGESMLPDEYDDEDETAVNKAVKFLQNKRYATEPSASYFHVGISYSTPDPDPDYNTGEETYYSCFLKGFTPEEELDIYNIITNQKQKNFNRTKKRYNF